MGPRYDPSILQKMQNFYLCGGTKQTTQLAQNFVTITQNQSFFITAMFSKTAVGYVTLE